MRTDFQLPAIFSDTTPIDWTYTKPISTKSIQEAWATANPVTVRMEEFGLPQQANKSRELMQKPKCKRPSRTDFMIRGKTFSQYLEKRFVVDNLGFKPLDTLLAASTDGGSIIASVVPQNPVEFLTYSHELGHVKSKQYQRGMEYGFSLYSSVCDNTLENELNAWVWGLKYFRRLGFTLCSAGKALVTETFSTYTEKCTNKDFVEYCWSTLYNKFDIQKPQRKNDSWKSFESNRIHEAYFYYDEVSPITERTEIEKPKGWKPWHDMKQKQIKRQWKQQR